MWLEGVLFRLLVVLEGSVAAGGEGVEFGVLKVLWCLESGMMSPKVLVCYFWEREFCGLCIHRPHKKVGLKEAS